MKSGSCALIGAYVLSVVFIPMTIVSFIFENIPVFLYWGVLILKATYLIIIISTTYCRVTVDSPDSDRPVTARTLYTLTNDSSAIMSNHIDYIDGELSNIPLTYRQITYVNLPITCSLGFVQMAERSTCPWRFRKNIDENRIPREITEAVCRSKYTSTCGPVTARLQHIRSGCRKQQCKEVKYFTRVLRRFSPNVHQYKDILEPISAGCTCICSALRPSDTSRHRPCH